MIVTGTSVRHASLSTHVLCKRSFTVKLVTLESRYPLDAKTVMFEQTDEISLMWPRCSPFLEQNALNMKKMHPISHFILSTPSIHQSQPASARATCLLLSPPHQPSPVISLSHESRLSNTAFPAQIFADLWVSLEKCVHSLDTGITNSSVSVSEGLHSVREWFDFDISAWMQLRSGMFSLDGDLRPWLAAPEVQQGGGEEVSVRSASRLSGLCWLVVLLPAPWSFTQPTSQPSHLPLTAHEPHHFLSQLLA